MRWMIHGADHKTGREMTVVIDADDRQEAEYRALYNDMLVSSIQQFVEGMALPPPPQPEPRIPDKPAPPCLDYNAPDAPPESRPPLAGAPFYKRILLGARWLGGLSSAIRIIGVIALLASMATVLVPLIEPVREWMPFPIIPTLWFVGAGLFMAIAFLCLFLGAVIAMLGELVLAVRDVARNSFRPELEPPPAQDPPRIFTPAMPRLEDGGNRLVIACSEPRPHLLPDACS